MRGGELVRDREDRGATRTPAARERRRRLRRQRTPVVPVAAGAPEAVAAAVGFEVGEELAGGGGKPVGVNLHAAQRASPRAGTHARATAGGTVAGIYTLGIVLIGQDFRNHKLAIVSTGFAMSYSAGCIVGSALGVITAAMRKLLTILNAILKSQTPWQTA